jgi:hypothetical protein
VTALTWDVFALASEDSRRDDCSETACAPWQVSAGERGAHLKSKRLQLCAAQSLGMFLVTNLGPGQGQKIAQSSLGKTIGRIISGIRRERAPPMDGRSNRERLKAWQTG